MERPAGVPAEAEYNVELTGWVVGSPSGGQRDGRWRLWSAAGKLVEDTTYQSGKRYGPSTVFSAATAAAYAVPGAAGLRGDFENGVRVGVWHVLAANGKRLLSRDFGASVSDDDLAESPALANQRRSAAEWLAVAESFARERRFGEAIVARARGAARSASVNGFLAAFAELSLPTTPGGAEIIANEVLREGDHDLAALVSGFLRGGSPAILCRALSVWADEMNLGFTALDLVNAALLVTPTRPELLATRAQVLMRLGLPAEVELDVKQLATSEPERAADLLAQNRTLFRVCDFWPSRAVLTNADGAVAPKQSLTAVQSLVATYARRLMMMREALLEHVRADVWWMVPDLTDLLRDDELGPDEQVDLTALELPDLQRYVHDDWGALTWLCWSVGLARVAMPMTVSAPADFASAHAMLTQGTAPAGAMMRWLTDPQRTSPWQES